MIARERVAALELVTRELSELLARDDEGGVSAGQVQRVITAIELLPPLERFKRRDTLRMLRGMKAARL